MFSPNPKNDPLLSAIKGVIAENDKHREAVDRANKHFKVTDKRQLPHNLHAYYDKMLSESTTISEKITKSTPMADVIRDFEKSDAPQFEGKSKEKRRQMAIAAKMAMNESLKGNQHKIDANKNNRIDAEDFKMLRNKNMSAEDVMKEAISNLAEKDSLSEAEKNILMELDVTDTEVMNSDLYKNAIKAVKDPRRIQIGQEVEGLGKFEKGDTIFSKVRSALAAQKTAPVVARNDVPTTSEPMNKALPSTVPVADQKAAADSVLFSPTRIKDNPNVGLNINNRTTGDLGNAGMLNPISPPSVPVRPVNNTSMVAGQNVRNDNMSQLPSQVTIPANIRGYGSDSLTDTIKSMFADRIKR